MNSQIEPFILEKEDTQYGRFLTFELGEEIYGIEIRHITEIIGMQSVTKLPDMPDYVKGIINLRGKIIPVTDMRLRFKKDAMLRAAQCSQPQPHYFGLLDVMFPKMSHVIEQNWCAT